MKIKDVSPAEIEFLKDVMDNEEFNHVRSKELTEFGGYHLYFDDNDQWKKYTLVPPEIKGLILGYRYAKRYRDAR